jgi:hypothetical protein
MSLDAKFGKGSKMAFKSPLPAGRGAGVRGIETQLPIVAVKILNFRLHRNNGRGCVSRFCLHAERPAF